jgi:hypothetical protein
MPSQPVRSLCAHDAAVAQTAGPVRDASQVSNYPHASCQYRHTVAIFRQINKGALHINHDALEFPDGEIVLLTRLYEGQKATVLSQAQVTSGSTPQLSQVGVRHTQTGGSPKRNVCVTSTPQLKRE